jgi:hypothetical protein
MSVLGLKVQSTQITQYKETIGFKQTAANGPQNWQER